MQSYRELIVWQKSMQLVKLVYVLTEQFPKEEQFGLTSQLRRASVSVPSNIAEGYVRRARKDYARFIAIARGSAAEVETQFEIAKMLGYSDEVLIEEALALVDEVMRMLTALHGKLASPQP